MRLELEMIPAALTVLGSVAIAISMIVRKRHTERREGQGINPTLRRGIEPPRPIPDDDPGGSNPSRRNH